MLTRMANAEQPPRGPRPQLNEFKGSPSEDAKGWLRKFDLLSTRYNWTNEEKIFQLSFNLSGAAGSWLSAQSDMTQSSWDDLRRAFESRFVNSEPALVIEAKLYNRRLLPNETIDMYYADIIGMGNQLGREPKQMAATFVQGLPELMRDYVLGTDTHTIESYTNRAKLYASRYPHNATAMSPVQNIQALVCKDDEMKGLKTELVNAVTESFKSMSFQRGRGRNNTRNRDFGRNYRGRRDRSDSRGKSPHGQSPNYRRRGNSRSPGRKVRFGENDVCWVCGSPQHWARECPERQGRQPKE